MKQTFERCADKTLLEEVRPTYAERGAQYADTWDPKNTSLHFTREAFAALRDIYPESIGPKEIQLLHLAALVDVKISRMTGGFRSDTVIDLIAYLAAYKTLREEYEDGHDGQPPDHMQVRACVP